MQIVNKVRGLMLLTVMTVTFLYVHINALVQEMYWGRQDIATVMSLATMGVMVLTFRQYQKVCHS